MYVCVFITAFIIFKCIIYVFISRLTVSGWISLLSFSAILMFDIFIIAESFSVLFVRIGSLLFVTTKIVLLSVFCRPHISASIWV